MEKNDYKKQAQEILKIAEESGTENNYFFCTTFERYQMQLKILSDLEKSIKEESTLVTKQYVKGRKNLYSNPAIAEYNKTSDSANKTVACLMKIIKNNSNDGKDKKDDDPLMAAINGSDEDE